MGPMKEQKRLHRPESIRRWLHCTGITVGLAFFPRRQRWTASSKIRATWHFAATSPGGADAGDVVHAIDRLRQVAEEGGSLADAADAFEADGEATSEVERLPLEPGRTDVVR